MNTPYIKRDQFFYIIMSDTQTNRDNKISELFDETIKEYYLGSNHQKVDNLSMARFWKDNVAPRRLIEKLTKANQHLVLRIVETDRETFLKITEDIAVIDYVTRRNIKLRESELEYLEMIKNTISF